MRCATVLCLMLASALGGSALRPGSASAQGQGIEIPVDVREVIVHPERRSVLYVNAGPQGLFKSHNGGSTWHRLDQGIPTWLNIVDLELSREPQGPDRLLACVLFPFDRASGALHHQSHVYRSDNGGQTWEFSGEGTESFRTDLSGFVERRIVHVAQRPGDPDVVYAGSAISSHTGGVFLSTNGGHTWTQIAGGAVSPEGQLVNLGGLLDNDAGPFAFEPANPLTMYAGGVHRAFSRSFDGGFTWERFDPTPLEAGTVDVGVNPNVPAEVHLGIVCGACEEPDQSWLSHDRGATWTPHPDFSGALRELAFAASNPQVGYGITVTGGFAATASRFYRTPDGGSTWQQVVSEAGLPSALRVQAVAIDPDDPLHIFLGTADRGVFESFDGGETASPPRRPGR